MYVSDQDSKEEECQEGDSVLSDGVRCFRNRCGSPAHMPREEILIEYHCAGRTTFVNTLCGRTVLEGKDADDAENAHLEEGVKIKPITVGKHYQQLHYVALQG